MPYKIKENKKTKIFVSPEYNYVFNKLNGNMMSWGKTPDEDPDVCPYGPVIADIEISTICHGINGTPCSFCYKSNTAKGENMSFETFKKIFDILPKTLNQIAFGVGSISNKKYYKIINEQNFQMCIYKTTNLINNKIYIGKQSRKYCKYFGSGIMLLQAIREYGLQNFKKQLIQKCNTCEELNERQEYWISFYDSTNPNIGYNISTGGAGWKYDVSKHPKRKEIVKRMSDTAKGKRNGKNNSFYGKHHDKQTIENQSKLMIEKAYKNFDFSKVIQLYVDKKYSIVDICKELKIGGKKVKRALKINNIKLDPGIRKGYKLGKDNKNFINVNKEIVNKIIDLYVNQKLTMGKISKIVNLKYNKIRNILMENNIKFYTQKDWSKLK